MGCDNNIIEKLLGLHEIKGFHYDNRDWSVGEIDDGMFSSRLREYCVSAVGRMRDFLEMPYVEDVFGGDDKARDAWRSKFSMGPMFKDLNSVSVFGVAKLNGMSLGEGLIFRNYVGNHVESLERYKVACDFLMPHWEESGEHCRATREQYNGMGFDEKRSHVYRVKANVFGFLNCLANGN
jgi:hypothetical protein